MGVNPEFDGIVTLPVAEPPVEPANGHRVELAVALPEAPTIGVAREVPGRRGRRTWLGVAAVGVVAVVASGTLGYLTYTTTLERDATRHQLAITQTALETAQQEEAALKSRDAYVAMYVSDQGKVHRDYGQIYTCTGYGECRTAAQQLLTDLQAFQSDRKAANVPLLFNGADSNLGDAISAAMAADQELISGMDTENMAKVRDGIAKLDAAMLAIAKVEMTVGTGLRG